MLYQDVLIRDLAAKYKKDPRIIESIIYSPLKFAKKVINDDTDNRPIRIRYLGVFTQKHIKNKYNRMERFIEDLEKDMKVTSIVMATILHFPLVNADSAKRIIDRAKEEEDYDKIKMIWDAVKEYKNGRS
jgi:hypothetical protein